MGKKGRERRQRVEAGLEKPKRDESLPSQVATYKGQLENMSLNEQAAEAIRVLKKEGVNRFKPHFIRGFRDDLKDKLSSGMTSEDVINLYWNTPNFVTFWGMLNMTRDNFEEIVVQISPKPTTKEPVVLNTEAPQQSLVSRLKSIFSKPKEKIEELQIKAAASNTNFMLNIFDKTLEKKIEMLKKNGEPLTLERLRQGSQALYKLGITQDEIDQRITERLAKENA